MQSTAKDVTTYINEAPAEWQGALLLTQCRNGSRLRQPEEFHRPIILRTDVIKTHRDQLQGTGVSIGKGAIRYSKPERINFEVMESMLRDTQESTGPVC